MKNISFSLGTLDPNVTYSNNVSFSIDAPESELFFYPDDRIRMTYAKRRDVALDLNTGKLKLKEHGNEWKESRIDLFDIIEELGEWAFEGTKGVFDIEKRKKKAKEKFPDVTDEMLEIRAFLDIKETFKINPMIMKRIVREVHHDDLMERSK